MNAPWAWTPTLPASAPATVVLSEEESRHAAGSRRLRVGDSIVLFNGLGLVANGVVSAQKDRSGALEVSVQSVSVVPRATPTIEIAAALPKGDRLASLLEAIGPLAAARFTPLTCERSVVAWGPSMDQRAQRVLVASCKQARQPWLPEIAHRATVNEVAASLAARGCHVLIAHPGGGSLREAVVRQPREQALAFMIGPEGGFTEAEVAAAKSHGAVAVTLGSAVLRIELAAAAILATCRVG